MTRRRIALCVNGSERDAWVLPSDTLLDVLHDGLGLAEVRYGCGEGVCGTCTVLLDGEPVSGCLTLAVQAAGREVTTLRGLAGPGGALHPLQDRFLRRGAAQCGFCTPGMVLTSLDLVRRHLARGLGPPSRDDIRYALVGNLCRCTGYTKIIDAVAEYAALAAAGTPPAGTSPARTPPARTPPARTPPARTPPARTPPARTPPAAAP
ncbi:MAG TPA: (2Fe-2S)-binding protein [Streptosporangiaceae bacterium]|nr:(2Fe-2S)-binding protein [Streptosporangiaceae bacterium]